jgi:hypothetical protein
MTEKRAKAAAARKPAAKKATTSAKAPTAPKKVPAPRKRAADIVRGAYQRQVEGNSDTMIQTGPGRFINAVSAQKLGIAKGD